MRTTLDIDEALLTEVVETTGESSKTKAVSKALSEFVRSAKRKKLQKLAGGLELGEDWKVWRETEYGHFREFGLHDSESK